MFQAVAVAALCSQFILSAEPAQGSAPTASSVASAAPVVAQEKPARSAFTKYGVLLDAGVFDGIGLSFQYRPLSYLRVHGGLTQHPLTNGFGLRAGATLSLYYPITPSLSLDVGHYFSGDVNRIESSSHASLTHTYVNLHVGLETGSPRYFMFFLRGGFSYANAGVNDLNWVVSKVGKDTSGNITTGPASLSGIFPTVKLGFSVFFL